MSHLWRWKYKVANRAVDCDVVLMHFIYIFLHLHTKLVFWNLARNFFVLQKRESNQQINKFYMLPTAKEKIHYLLRHDLRTHTYIQLSKNLLILYASDASFWCIHLPYLNGYAAEWVTLDVLCWECRNKCVCVCCCFIFSFFYRIPFVIATLRSRRSRSSTANAAAAAA